MAKSITVLGKDLWTAKAEERHAGRRCREPRAGSEVTEGISSPETSGLQLVLAGTDRSVSTYYSTHKSSGWRQRFACAAAGKTEGERGMGTLGGMNNVPQM